MHESLGQSDPLPKTLGEISDQSVGALIKREIGHNGITSLPDLPMGHFPELCGKRQIFPHRHIHIERGHLGQIADLCFCLFRHINNTDPVDQHIPCRRSQISCHNIHRRGFSRTVRTQKAVYAALFDRKIQILHSDMISVSFCQISDFYQTCFLRKLYLYAHQSKRFSMKYGLSKVRETFHPAHSSHD